MIYRIEVLLIFWTEKESPDIGIVKFHLFVIGLLPSDSLVSL
jgi:hypothetical protein